MIILITGASHTGKTYLAQRMLEKYKYPYLSIDHLKMGLIRSGNTELTPEDDDELTEYLWPIVREIIKTAIENRQNLIVEGCYIPFDWRQDFDKEYLSCVRLICLAMTENYIDANFDKIVSYASIVENRLNDSDCTIEGLKADNKKYMTEFGDAGERIVLIHTNYEQEINELLDNDGGVNMKWKCPKCGREFSRKDQSHFCGKPETIDEYIAAQDEAVQPKLNEIRSILQTALPDAEERISWSMPTYWKGKNIIHFAASKKHLGLYPGGEAATVFSEELSGFNVSKGTIRLPYDKPLPSELIEKIAQWCYEEYRTK